MMKLIEDLGSIFPNPDSKYQARMGIYECTKCQKHVRCYTTHVKRTNRELCDTCGNENKAKPFVPAKQEEYAMRLVEDLGRIYPTPTSKRRAHYVLLECLDCKKHVRCTAKSSAVKKQKYCLSCSNQYNNLKHGDNKSRLYKIYMGMKKRCYGKTSVHNNNVDYIAKGITVCDEWLSNYESFKEWSLANGYTDELTIDRENNDLGYSPDNCRWTTRTVQARNTKVISKNNTSGYRGVSIDKGRYRARITVDYRGILIGMFDDPLAAAIAYDTYIVEHSLEHSTNGLLNN
jgi:hypothetical protein